MPHIRSKFNWYSLQIIERIFVYLCLHCPCQPPNKRPDILSKRPDSLCRFLRYNRERTKTFTRECRAFPPFTCTRICLTQSRRASRIRAQQPRTLGAMTPGRRWINGPNKARNGPANRILLIKVLPGKKWQRGKEGAKVFSKKLKFSTHFVTSSAVNAGHEAPATYKRA